MYVFSLYVKLLINPGYLHSVAVLAVVNQDLVWKHKPTVSNQRLTDTKRHNISCLEATKSFFIIIIFIIVILLFFAVRMVFDISLISIMTGTSVKDDLGISLNKTYCYFLQEMIFCARKLFLFLI